MGHTGGRRSSMADHQRAVLASAGPIDHLIEVLRMESDRNPPTRVKPKEPHAG